ncbi:fumarylacetoacetate hydrolase family protein [Micromonospora vulcania]|uniref:Fumarylacetoacetate hydrolase family protein n=1 Tax=Micromonospora vulcania TaxID=1441873 RepID=A0ABW1H4X3_9ACTN
MQIVRATVAGGEPDRAAVRTERGLHLLPSALHELLALPASELRQIVEAAAAADPVPTPATVALRAPVSGLTEVWAAGVTYERSRTARMAESEREADIYDRVYDAERPELFFKAASWRVVGPGGAVSIRSDSAVNVPEPELAVVVNRHGEIVGYTICDDVSSRSIEGENPLYLPQAKTYLGACAVGPGITPAWEVPEPYALPIHLSIERGGEVVWSGAASTAQLHRKLPTLVEFLFRADEFPHGVVLATGTSLVPDLPFTLREGDTVAIEITGLGVLTNSVVVGKAGVAALVAEVAR